MNLKLDRTEHAASFGVIDMLGGDRAVSVENKIEHLPRALIKSGMLTGEVHHDGLSCWTKSLINLIGQLF